MNISQVWIAVTIVALAVVVFLVLFVNKNRKKNRLTPLVSLVFAFVLAGTFFRR